MQAFHYSNGQFSVEGVPLNEIDKRFGTPCFVYSSAAIESQWHAYDKAFGDRSHTICYSVKANGNIGLLNLLARLGSGFDIVSAGELQRVIKAGGDPARTVFSGVGKRPDEVKTALESGIKCFNVESHPELKMINSVAGELGLLAPVSIRINPDVDAKTHPYISTGLKENKFGVAFDDAEAVYQAASRLENLEIIGIDCHIGSQITSLGPYQESINTLMVLVESLATGGITLRHIDVGGGLGITYQDEEPPSPSELVECICSSINDKTYELIIEPGRSIVGNAGILLTKVLFLKNNSEKNFAIVDAAMNDFIRPVFYDAWQEIVPVEKESDAEPCEYDIVGPICESGDYLGLNRRLSIIEGNLLAVLGVGAYGFCMSSNYNARPRAAEVLVDNEQIYEIRRRERVEELYQGEYLLP